MTCLPDALVRRFVAGRATASEIDAIDAHLDGCAACRERVAHSASDEELARRSVPPPDQTAHARPRAGQPSEPPPAPREDDPRIGQVVAGRYRVLRLLGKGGMGAVYEAEHVLIGRRIALKVLHATYSGMREIVRRFHNEARAAGTLGHPNIISAIDTGTTEQGEPFIVLELLEGRDVASDVEKHGAMAVDRALRIAADTASALAAAHAKGIVHRDLKPENVFLARGENGDVVKVLDFGISKFGGSAERGGLVVGVTGPETAPGVFLGTPRYMAPEQLGDASAVDARADVYALGAMLWFMLAGRPPVDAGSLPEILRIVFAGEIERLDAVRDDLPDGLADVVARAMHKEREERFVDAASLAEALRPWVRQRSLPPARDGEARLVTLVVARGVADVSAVRAALLASGAEEVVTKESDVVAVLGAGGWRAGDATRATRAAWSVRALAEGVAVLRGRALVAGGAVSESALAEGRRLASAGCAGVAVATDVARELDADVPAVRIAPEAFEVDLGVEVSGPADAHVGRAVELAEMERWLRTASDESRGVLGLVAGPAGSGKSRLVETFVEKLREVAPETVVLAGRAEPWRARAFGLLASAIVPRGGEVSRAEAAAIAAESGVAPAELFALLGAPEPVKPGDERAARDRRRLAALGHLRGLVARGPTLLVLDDVDRADVESVELVVDLVRDVAGPLLVVATWRADAGEPRPEPLVGADAGELRLRGLSLGEVRALAEATVGRAVDAEVARALLERTAGQPFFVRQLVVQLADEGALDAAAIGGATLPSSVEAAAFARLDALEPAERDAVRAASVLARPFVPEDLRALGIESAPDVVAKLAARDVLGRVAGGKFAPRSSVLSDVALRSAGDAQRRELHRRAAELLLLRGGTELEALGRHLELAGEPSRAARSFRDAATEALARGDASAALRAAEAALRLGVQRPDAWTLHMARASALAMDGRLAAAEVELDAAAKFASEIHEHARTELERAVCILQLGRLDDALVVMDVAVAAAERAGDDELCARATGSRAAALVYAGRLPEASAALRKAERLVTTRAPSLRAAACSWRAQLASALGDLGDRLHAYEACVELYRDARDPRRAAQAEVSLADAYNRLGAYASAERATRAALETCRRLRMRIPEGYALANLGYALVMQRRTGEALDALDDALRIAAESSERRLSLYARLYRARALLFDGEVASAMRDARALGEDAEVGGHQAIAAVAWAHVAHAAVALEAWDEALASSARGVELRDALGGVEEDEGDIFLARVRALSAIGDTAGAAEALARGRGRLRDVAMRISDPDARDRFLHDVPAHAALEGAA